MMKRIAWIVAVLFVFSAIAAFSDATNTIIEESTGSIPTLDPAWSYDTTSGEAIYQLYDNLIQYDGTSLTNFIPMLSTNVPNVKDGTLLDNGKTYVFNIRQGVKFHNGDTLTPQDVVYSLERTVIFDRNGGPSWMLTEAFMPTIGGAYVDSITQWAVKLAGVKSYSDLFVEGTSTPKNAKYKEALIQAFGMLSKVFEIKGNQVIIHLPHVYPVFFDIMAHSRRGSSILDMKWAASKGAWPGTADTWWVYNNPTREKDPLYSIENGTGPFTLERWTPGREIVFQRFDGYWAGPAKIKYAIIKRVQEFTTRKLDLMRGNADIINVPFQYLPQVQNVSGITIDTYPSLQINAIHFTWQINTSGNRFIGSGKLDGNGIPPDFFANKDVRLGFAYLFAYKNYVNQAWYGKALIPNSPIPQGLLGYNPTNPPIYRQDLSKAEYYFKKAYNGELWNKGFNFTAVYNTGNDQRKTALEIMRYYAMKINPKFKISIVGELWSSFLDDYGNGKLPAYLLGWVSDYPDPYDLVWTYLGSTGDFGNPLGANYVAWAQKNIDPLLLKSMQTVDPAVRASIYTQLAKIAHEEALYIFTTQPDGLNVMSSEVQGWFYNSIRPGQDFYTLWKK